MSFLLTFMVLFASMAMMAVLAARKFFLTNEAAGYVFVVINWTLLFVAAAVFALVIKLIESFFIGA